MSGARFERNGGDLLLVVDPLRFGFGGITEESMPGSQRIFDHLVVNGFFEVDRCGKDWSIRLGSLALAAREGRRSK